jgi:hypothetical protein
VKMARYWHLELGMHGADVVEVIERGIRE